MGGVRSSKKSSQDHQRLRASLSYPNFQLEIESSTPNKTLPELRRIVEALTDDELPAIEDMNLFEMKARLSEEFFQHPDLLSRLKNSFLLDEDIRLVKQVLPFEQEYDLDTGKATKQVNVLNVKQRISTLFDFDTSQVKECLVHIRGELSREQQCVIMDAIKQHLGVEVKPRFFLTKKNLEGKVLLETICFGQNISEQSGEA